jgi:hypothetical protein
MLTTLHAVNGRDQLTGGMAVQSPALTPRRIASLLRTPKVKIKNTKSPPHVLRAAVLVQGRGDQISGAFGAGTARRARAHFRRSQTFFVRQGEGGRVSGIRKAAS